MALPPPPPSVLPFALGSLCFISNFHLADYYSVTDNAIDDDLRMRRTCIFYHAIPPEPVKGRSAMKKVLHYW
ncbi:hypothetical protein PHLCEN_2v5643 [Hermanssonia centrifuga]|uniref:Uncharacterized protein n=1 Tax=Hermanssonia centrifuga TaxID=98765 RepID=A0A2R6P1U2_9APHY|nr:hypothetical protein PHLCEN_2v5643 [Hermanssonia centrifuga]